MKSLKFLAVLLLIPALVFVTGCKKDDDDDDDNNNSSNQYYRVVLATFLEDNIETDKTEIEYDGEKIKLMSNYIYDTKGEWVLDNKQEVTYPDANKVQIIHSENVDSAWVQTEKESVTFQNGLKMEDIWYVYDGSAWVIDYKDVYSYNDADQLVELTSYWYDPMGTAMEIYRITLTWLNNLVTEIIYFEWFNEAWQAYYNQTVTYNGNQIVKIENSDPETSTVYGRSTYQYSNNLIALITNEYYFEGTWEFSGSNACTYDGAGNLISELWTNPENSTSKSVYTYESGKGNITSIFGYEMSNFGLYPFPTKDQHKNHFTRELVSKALNR